MYAPNRNLTFTATHRIGLHGMSIEYYGDITVQAAMARARRLSLHNDTRRTARTWNEVTISGDDSFGGYLTFTFLKGKMIKKTITQSKNPEDYY